MKITNYTPWPDLAFESRTPDDEAFGVLVMRGTFRIMAGEALRPLPHQAPIALDDVYRGEPGRSSLRSESDLAPFKPRTDIHLDAVARAPHGRPSASWPVRVRVGSIHKDLLVRGPCVWRHRSLGGWMLSEPAPCLEVPIVYENAFGGSFALRDGSVLSDPHNPVGTGWLPDEAPRDAEIRAPQVLGIDEPTHRAGRTHTPQGYGPLAPQWQPRLARAGTFDRRWVDERCPVLPRDFDYSFYNSAHPDLVYPTIVRGDEPIDLVHLTPDRSTLSFRLPGYELVGVVRSEEGRLCPFGVALDTVHIDVTSAESEEHRVSLTWRACFPSEPAIDVLEIRMYLPGESAYLRAMAAERKKLRA